CAASEPWAPTMWSWEATSRRSTSGWIARSSWSETSRFPSPTGRRSSAATPPASSASEASLFGPGRARPHEASLTVELVRATLPSNDCSAFVRIDPSAHGRLGGNSAGHEAPGAVPAVLGRRLEVAGSLRIGPAVIRNRVRVDLEVLAVLLQLAAVALDFRHRHETVYLAKAC